MIFCTTWNENDNGGSHFLNSKGAQISLLRNHNREILTINDDWKKHEAVIEVLKSHFTIPKLQANAFPELTFATSIKSESFTFPSMRGSSMLIFHQNYSFYCLLVLETVKTLN